MRTLLTTAALAALLVPAAADTRATSDDFTWTGRVAAGQTIEVYGINGEIEAVAGSGDATVSARKRARRSDPADVKIEVVEHAGGVTICAVYPGGGTCTPGKGVRGGRGTRDNDVVVDFDLQVPSGVKTVLNTVNGGVEARGLDADVDAQTVNGGIEVDTRGVARARTVNGSLRASMGQADWEGEMELETVNGSIRVEMPESLSADVEVHTVNGSIETDFPLTVRGKFGPRHASGRIGNGGRELSLKTVNGAIRLAKR